MEYEEIKKRVIHLLDQIRPYLQNDGGDMEFIELTTDYIVKLKLKGACHACPMAMITLKEGIEETLKTYIPEIKEVVNVID
ncbi:MAG TPA: NifU family protein [Bacteroidales bacterium]|jgi:Fe-S cluster biogenesis protein NfuA|nr:NifU family protein [Bacteroidales bacterium]MDY0401519.1 NifU family protein [Bacteroidales bacterium]HOB77298.1 NifU family protein [Bacteroidales bacterium]HPZ61524.1 NifU family protein [Bacteroidales bacterium]HQD59257.1 NifU family protein [Bacteroidales bacterium]